MTHGRTMADAGGPRARHCRTGVLGAVLVAFLLVSGCGSVPPPKRQHNVCEIFKQYPDWYDYARKSERQWGTPVSVQMAFVRQESSFRSHARPAREWLWFIPLGRPSTAKGYAQAANPVWGDYQKERGSFFSSRSDMEDALDFIGWYNHKTARELRISKRDARNLYLAYHEGRTGYRRGSWKNKPKLRRNRGACRGNRGELPVPAQAVPNPFPMRFLVSGLAVLQLIRPRGGLPAARKGGP